uniref:Exoribonuclease phosphorolytic domain-containing protein n=1 Tax=Zea mays TaxID=4577 RepID=A0A804P5Y8_MAIZE
MEGGSRADGRNPNQLRPFTCTGNPLHRAHGSARWAQGDTVVLAAVYGPKSGTRKGENPEKASIEVVWKPKTGQIGRQEREYEMTLKRTLQSICLLTVHPNTTTSVVLQQARSFAHLVFPNSRKSVESKDTTQRDEESERGLITCITHGAMSEDDYFNCIERGVMASSRISDFMRKTLQKEASRDA